MVAPRRAPAREGLDGSSHALGDVDERVAELPPELVPPGNALARLFEQSVRHGLVFVHPRFGLLERDLGMELHSPSAVAQPECLGADAAARELDRAVRNA